LSLQRSKIIDAANEFKVPVCFRDDVEFHRDYILMTWSDGTQTRVSIQADPIMVNDNSTIKLNYRLISTRSNVI